MGESEAQELSIQLGRQSSLQAAVSGSGVAGYSGQVENQSSQIRKVYNEMYTQTMSVQQS